MSQSFTNFSNGGIANQPTSWVASDGFVGAPTSPFNPNAPTFAAAGFPEGANIPAGETLTVAGVLVVNGTTVNPGGTISTAGVTATGKVAAATIASTGAVTGATIASTGFIDPSTANALTATGSNVATGLVLTSQQNFVTTAAASTGVVLPTVASAGIGAAVVVFNEGANPIKVYGGGSDTIDGAAAGTGVTLTNAKRCLYFAVAAATWISAQLGVASA